MRTSRNDNGESQIEDYGWTQIQDLLSVANYCIDAIRQV